MSKLQDHINNYEITLKQLESNTFSGYYTQCAKCIYVNKYDVTCDCGNCSETIHNVKHGCCKRKTSSHKYEVSTVSNKHSILYHKGAIKYLKSRKRYNHKAFQKELLRLDKEIGNK